MKPVLFLALVAGALLGTPATSAAQATVRTVAARPADSTAAAAPAPARRPSPRNQLVIQREAFSYAQEGRRDPFVSLMNTSELRPMPSDLRLVVVVYDADGDSRAVLRDVNTKEQYKVRLGQQLGRMRVARINPKSITFSILEFGESRQVTLALNDSTTARTP